MRGTAAVEQLWRPHPCTPGSSRCPWDPCTHTQCHVHRRRPCWNHRTCAPGYLGLRLWLRLPTPVDVSAGSAKQLIRARACVALAHVAPECGSACALSCLLHGPCCCDALMRMWGRVLCVVGGCAGSLLVTGLTADSPKGCGVVPGRIAHELMQRERFSAFCATICSNLWG